MALTKAPSETCRVNLAGHCPFCLTQVATTSDTGQAENANDSLQLRSLSFLWPYLRFGEKAIYQENSFFKVPRFTFASENSTQEDDPREPLPEVPPVCRSCLEEVKILKGVHEDLMMVRNTLKEQVKRVQGIILQTETSQGDFARDKFEKFLKTESCLLNEDCVRDTLKFLEFIRSADVKREVASSSGPVYPLTTCELLFPVELDESESDPGEIGEAPEVKQEPPSGSDVDDSSNFDVIQEDSGRNRRRATTNFKTRRRKQVLKSRRTYYSNDSSNTERFNTEARDALDSGSSTGEEDNNDNDDNSDPEFIPSDEEAFFPAFDSVSERGQDGPASDLLAAVPTSIPKTKASNKLYPGEVTSLGDPVPAKRKRGRPRKSLSESSSQKRSKYLSIDPSTVPVSAAEPKSVRRYSCDSCDILSFTTEVALVRHKVESHGLEIPHKCKTCSQPFYTQRSLYHHQKKEHPDITPDPMLYPCNICGKSFSTRTYVEHHKKVGHFKEKPFKCLHCDKTFTTKLGRDLHTKAFHLRERFECSECNKVFNFQHLMERHQETQHPYLPAAKERLRLREERLKGNIKGRGKPPNPRNPKISNSGSGGATKTSQQCTGGESNNEDSSGPPPPPRRRWKKSPLNNYKCDLCPDSEPFFTQTNLLHHKQRVHGLKIENKLQCTHCTRSFVTPRALRNHQVEHHPGVQPDPVKYPCDQCQKSFSALFTLRIHQRVVHQKEVLYKCDECQKVFQNSMGLRFHIQAVHQGIRFSCNICQKQFKYESAINRHKAEVHKLQVKSRKPKEKEKFTCTFCQPPESAPSFIKQDSLQFHCITTHGADPHQCDSCEEKFLWRKQLQNHVKRVHQGVEEKGASKEKKTYTCQHCQKVYLNKDNWKTHLMKKHDPDWPKKAKPYVCEFCQKSYIHREGYKSHLKMQHRYTTQHLCSICGMSFKNPQYLRNHMRNHTNVRSHHCSQCPARFKRKDTCDKHIKYVHNREKQRNVGIRRMHFRPYEDELARSQGAGTAVDTVASTSAPSSSEDIQQANCSTAEVKPSDTNPKELVNIQGLGSLNVEGGGVNFNPASFQHMYGLGFMNL